MITDNIHAFKTTIPGEGRLLGLDLGTKTIGIALSDSSQSIATPIETLKRKKFTPDANYLKQFSLDEMVVGWVVGLPLHMHGEQSPRSQSAKQFCANIQKIYDIPILLWDERLSSIAAERTLLDADISREKRTKVIDKMAASIILQGALDTMKNTPL